MLIGKIDESFRLLKSGFRRISTISLIDELLLSRIVITEPYHSLGVKMLRMWRDKCLSQSFQLISVARVRYLMIPDRIGQSFVVYGFLAVLGQVIVAGLKRAFLYCFQDG